MRKFLISTIERRAGANFNLKDVGGRNVIANMTINPSTARHEAWISEADFLKFSKDLALLGRTPGCAVHVLKIEDTEPQIPRIPAFMEFIEGYNIALDLHPLPDEASTAARAGYSLGLEEAKRPPAGNTITFATPPNAEPKIEQPKFTADLASDIEADVKLAKTMGRLNGDELTMTATQVIAACGDSEFAALVKIPYLKLKSIAKTEGVSLECLDKGSRALAGRILAHRKNTVSA